MPNKSWTVATSGDRPLDDVASDLKKSGFNVADVLSEIGCITGDADDDAAEKARGIKGVTDVSATPSVDIGPPDSSETW